MPSHGLFSVHTPLVSLPLIRTPVLLTSGPNFMTSFNLNYLLKSFIHLFTELSYNLSDWRLGLQHVHGGRDTIQFIAGSKRKAVVAFRKV